MNAAVTRNVPVDDAPIEDFSHCHEGILAGLNGFAGLPALQQAAAKARETAAAVLRLMDEAVMAHHEEEEEELFSAVVRSAQAGAERERATALVQQLTEEHRAIEALWDRLRADVKAVAAGRNAPLDARAVRLLVAAYRDHAQLEERELLPMARDILGRNGNHMAALGLALHMRHRAVPAGYI